MTSFFFCFSKEPQLIPHRNPQLNEYYESLRNNVITLLEQVRIPNGGPASTSATGDKPLPGGGGGANPPHNEHFDSYLSKLQSLCATDGYGPPDENRPIYESVKSALQDFTMLPTAI